MKSEEVKIGKRRMTLADFWWIRGESLSPAGRSGLALTCPRHVIHSQPVRFPFGKKEKRAFARSFFFGGSEGNRSRLRARSGLALTCPRHVIHSQPVRFPFGKKEKRAFARSFFFGGSEGNRTPVRKPRGRTFFVDSLLFRIPFERRQQTASALR